MPPKPQVFKTPDGKEFNTKAEWRDYMMLTFYSFKNKVDEPQPLIKAPGSIDGQMFDIGDCKNSTLAVLDQTEQVQIDQTHDCKIMIGACTSSIFIRNCSNCVFYTSCRQLRLREVVNCTFYIYSMAEVHIEYSNNLRFAPFNGGYPEQAKHMAAARLDVNHNLWYDIYDHNDPSKSHANWNLLPEDQYEEPWFPIGPCEPAVPRTKAGTVPRPEVAESMQSFSLQQMIQDAQKLNVAKPEVPSPPQTTSAPVPPPVPAEAAGLQFQSKDSDEQAVFDTVKAFAEFKAGGSLSTMVDPSFTAVLPSGKIATANDLELAAPASSNTVVSINSMRISTNKDLAAVVFTSKDEKGQSSITTAVLVKGANSKWTLVNTQKSN